MLCIFCKDKVWKEEAGEPECLCVTYEDVAWRTALLLPSCLSDTWLLSMLAFKEGMRCPNISLFLFQSNFWQLSRGLIVWVFLIVWVCHQLLSTLFWSLSCVVLALEEIWKQNYLHGPISPQCLPWSSLQMFFYGDLSEYLLSGEAASLEVGLRHVFLHLDVLKMVIFAPLFVWQTKLLSTTDPCFHHSNL